MRELLSFTKGNIPEACRISGLSRSRLYLLLKKYNLSKSFPLTWVPADRILPGSTESCLEGLFPCFQYGFPFTFSNLSHAPYEIIEKKFFGGLAYFLIISK
jgi:hypothetical protein